MSLREVEPNVLAVTFGVDPRTDGVDAGMVRLDGALGLQPPDLSEIEHDLGVSASVEPGGIGVGAAGLGIELILAYASIPGDLIALAEIGRGVLKVIQRVRARRERTVVVSHGPTFAALAAASLPREVADALNGMEYVGCRNLSGGEPPNWVGTDDRHVWVVVFEHPTNGTMGAVFMAAERHRSRVDGRATCRVLQRQRFPVAVPRADRGVARPSVAQCRVDAAQGLVERRHDPGGPHLVEGVSRAADVRNGPPSRSYITTSRDQRAVIHADMDDHSTNGVRRAQRGTPLGLRDASMGLAWPPVAS